MIFPLSGRARRLGDGINTDYIISSRRKKESLDPVVLRSWLFETVDSNFASSVAPGDILVAGEAFGCGSAMEVAVTVVKAAGISAVLAQSFARTYYRNAINNALLPVECDTSGIQEGDRLELRRDNNGLLVVNETAGTEVGATPISPFTMRILAAGGLVDFLKTHGRFPESGR